LEIIPFLAGKGSRNEGIWQGRREGNKALEIMHRPLTSIIIKGIRMPVLDDIEAM
jgi:hypothetical protein